MLPIAALAAGAAKADFTAAPGLAPALLNAAKTGEADSTWDPGTNTLTLNGVNFSSTDATAVLLPEGAKIVLNGDNTITGGDASPEDCYGIYAWGDLSIEGSGRLTVTSGRSADQTCYGIYAHKYLIISGNVTASGGTVTAAGATPYDGSNHRNMSAEEEAAILAPFKERAEKGEMVEISEIAIAYQSALDHPVSNGQIYFVLRRHGWRKVMPRSKHPKKASEEEIAASKEFKPLSKN